MHPYFTQIIDTHFLEFCFITSMFLILFSTASYKNMHIKVDWFHNEILNLLILIYILVLLLLNLFFSIFYLDYCLILHNFVSFNYDNSFDTFLKFSILLSVWLWLCISFYSHNLSNLDLAFVVTLYTMVTCILLILKFTHYVTFYMYLQISLTIYHSSSMYVKVLNSKNVSKDLQDLCVVVVPSLLFLLVMVLWFCNTVATLF